MDTCLTVDSKKRVKKYHGHPGGGQVPPPRRLDIAAAAAALHRRGGGPRRRRGLKAPRRYHGGGIMATGRLLLHRDRRNSQAWCCCVRCMVISRETNMFYHENMHHGAPTRGSAVPRVVQNPKRGLPCTRVHVVSNYGPFDLGFSVLDEPYRM